MQTIIRVTDVNVNVIHVTDEWRLVNADADADADAVVVVFVAESGDGWSDTDQFGRSVKQ